MQKNKITSWKVWHQEDSQHHMSSKDFLYSIANLSKYLPQAWEKNKSKREQEQRVGEERFWHSNNTKRRCVKWGRGGSYLYLGAKSYPSWMLSKCPSIKSHWASQGGRTFRVLVDEWGGECWWMNPCETFSSLQTCEMWIIVAMWVFI